RGGGFVIADIPDGDDFIDRAGNAVADFAAVIVAIIEGKYFEPGPVMLFQYAHQKLRRRLVAEFAGEIADAHPAWLRRGTGLESARRIKSGGIDFGATHEAFGRRRNALPAERLA